jgi:hypothetical protein
MNSVDRCVAGGSGAPLSNEQKRAIVMLAREAWRKNGRPGFDDQPAGLSADLALSASEAFEIWRQDEQRQAAGTSHLTCARNDQYAAFMGHFARLAGRRAGEKYWTGRVVGDAHRQAVARLRREMAKAEDAIERPAEYLSAIARCKYRTMDIESLSPRQITVLTFDIRRAAQKRRAHVEGVPF